MGELAGFNEIFREKLKIICIIGIFMTLEPKGLLTLASYSSNKQHHILLNASFKISDCEIMLAEV